MSSKRPNKAKHDPLLLFDMLVYSHGCISRGISYILSASFLVPPTFPFFTTREFDFSIVLNMIPMFTLFLLEHMKIMNGMDNMHNGEHTLSTKGWSCNIIYSIPIASTTTIMIHPPWVNISYFTNETSSNSHCVIRNNWKYKTNAVLLSFIIFKIVCCAWLRYSILPPAIWLLLLNFLLFVGDDERSNPSYDLIHRGVQ